MSLFMDGSVHFIKNSVTFPAWYALATPAGGEVVSSDSYSTRVRPPCTKP